ncbi:hypothetical protein AG1IA_07381 [Rhizoctonia solani AG-1 IA]|uniref:Uncharacterized protein n=1 Tax=Thanatephorus cucumeris (strain AG1-IA) TaxID=983506 RepID=L8WP89_THACA|nr:hypothetical protein AG1IA_07381 [Rhizoctonia solani AG-1 IA]
MDTYLNSSAVNRRHYALTHKVENAPSVQEADTAIWLEIERIKKEIQRGLVSDQCTGGVSHPHVLLYCCCCTLRDCRRSGICAISGSESGCDWATGDEPARIVLALDFITSSPSQFLAPAVAPRLEVLLGHKSQNLRHRALLALRALDGLSREPSDSYLAHQSSTIIRRITRAAREDRIRSDEIGAVGALLIATRDLLQSGAIRPKDVITPIIALLEKTLSNLKQRPPRLVTSLLATLQLGISTNQNSEDFSDESFVEIAKLTTRLVIAFADRPGESNPLIIHKPASPNVLQAFRLLGALPVRILHSLFSPNLAETPSPGSVSQSPSKKPKRNRHPVVVLRPLLVSRDPTERWSGLTCLNSLDVRLWAGLPFEDGSDGTTKLIPPVLDEWEVGAIMRGLSDLDGTIRNLTMDLLYKVDPQLVHAFLEQLLTPPPTATAPTPQPKPVEALEVLSFLYPKDGASFARGVSKIVNITARREQGDGKKSAPAVNDKLVEGVILTVHEGDQAFRSAFVDALLESIERDMDTSSLISPLTPAAAGPSTKSVQTLTLGSKPDPTIILLFATTAIALSKPRSGVEILLTLLPGRGAGIQEVLLLAALRLLPRLEKTDTKAAKESVEEFTKIQTMGRHMRRVRLARMVHLPEFLQALLSHKPPSTSTPEVQSSLSSPKASTLRKVASPSPAVGRTISPEFSTVSLSNSPALRYDAYAPPQSIPRRTRPTPQSPFRRESEIRSSSSDSIVSSDLDAGSSTQKGKRSVSHLELDVTGSANPNADLITLHTVDSPFREENDFGNLSIDEAAARRTPDTSSPPFHTAVTASPHMAQDGGDLAPSDADAIWNSFDSAEADSSSSLGKQTLRGWCDRTPETMGNALRAIEVGFVTQKVGPKPGGYCGWTRIRKPTFSVQVMPLKRRRCLRLFPLPQIVPIRT